MKTIVGDIFNGSYDILIQNCNLYHTWGAGIVVPIKKRFPEAYQADLETIKGDLKKLGTYSSTDIGKVKIVNLYAQRGIGNDGHPLNRNCLYDKLYDALYRLCLTIDKPTVIGVPDMVGCGLAGGKREIVLAILQSLEYDFPQIEFHIFTKP